MITELTSIVRTDLEKIFSSVIWQDYEQDFSDAIIAGD
jgi:hypothetical protein